MALTSHAVLRAWTLATIASLPGREGTRAEVLAAMDRRYGRFWTVDDLEPPTTRPFETKWRNRVSYLRIRLIADGALVDRSDNRWQLTGLGVTEVASGPDSRALVGEEISRRKRLWDSLPPAKVLPSERVNALRIHRGGRSVYIDHDATLQRFPPSGAAVSVLATGRDYDDVLSDGGIVYAFPSTSDRTSDRTEIRALTRSHQLGLPIFVVSEESLLRRVQMGYIEDISDETSSLLVTFVEAPVEIDPSPPGADYTFDPHGNPPSRVVREVPMRPNQRRFAWNVGETYGRKCAVCDIAGPGMVDAAHLVPKARGGVDDPRNGLPLCPNHHRAHDRFHWAIEPRTRVVVLSKRKGAPAELGIKHLDVGHLPAYPHLAALESAWTEFQKAERGSKATRLCSDSSVDEVVEP